MISDLLASHKFLTEKKGGGIIVHSAWGCVLWVAQWRAARALDSQLEGLVGPV